MELDVLVICTIAITVCFLLINSFLLFTLLALASFFTIRYALSTAVDSFKARESPPRLEWLSKMISHATEFYNLLKSMMGAGDERSSTRKLRRAGFCKKFDSMEDEIETIVDCIVDEYILIWLEIVTPSNRDFSDDCREVFKDIFMKLINKFLANVDRDKFISKVVNLLSDSLSDPFTSQKMFESEHELVRNMVEELLVIIDIEEVSALKFERCTDKQQRDSLYILIRDLLTQAVFMPIVSIITDPNWINEQVVDLFEEPSRTHHDMTCVKRPKVPVDIESLKPQLRSIYNMAEHSLSRIDPRRASSVSLDRSVSAIPNPHVDLLKNNMKRSLSTDFCFDKIQNDSRTVSDDELSDCESGLEVGADVEDAMSTDNRLFTNIRIRESEEMRTRAERYTVYIVKYETLHEVMVENGNKYTVNFVRKESIVKRRFREFVNLQNRLEDNPTLRRFLRRIKKPSKLRVTTNTIFGGPKSDRETIAHRMIFLEHFLIDLCNREPIANSREMRQFLAYDSDARLAFANPKSTLPQVPQALRLDKVLVESLKGAVNMIKTALPVDFQDGQSIFPPKTGHNTLRYGMGDVDTRIGDSMNLELYLLNWDRHDLLLTQQISTEPSPTNTFKRMNKLSEYNESTIKQSFDFGFSTLPLTNAFVDLFSVISNETYLASIYTVLFKAVFGSLTERIIIKQINDHVTAANAVFLLHLLHESVWQDASSVTESSDTNNSRATSAAPNDSDCGGLNISRDHRPYDMKSGSISEGNVTMGDAERALRAFCEQQIPLYALVATKVNRAINYALSSLQMQERSKLFIYQLIHVITLEMQRTGN